MPIQLNAVDVYKFAENSIKRIVNLKILTIKISRICLENRYEVVDAVLRLRINHSFV